MNHRWARRTATRRALLAGGAALVVGGAVLEVERRNRQAALPTPVGEFYLGLNVSGLEDPIPAGPTAEMLDTYASYGVRRLRLTGRWEFAQPQPGGPLDGDYLDLYLGVVRDAAARGMTVLLEPCHNYGGRTIDGQDHKLGDGVLTSGMLADFWGRFTRAAGGVPGVWGWDLMEEPSDLPGDTPADQARHWVDAAQQAIDAVRATGDTRPIVVEAYEPGSTTPWEERNGALHTLHDPSDALVFSTHVFLDRDDSGRYAYWDEEVAAGDRFGGGPLTYDVGVKRIAPFVAWLRQHGLTGDIGECGAGWRDARSARSAAGWQIALETALSYCRDQGLAVYAWGAGPHLRAPYELSLEPQHGLPAPQWQVLEGYLAHPGSVAPSLPADAPSTVG